MNNNSNIIIIVKQMYNFNYNLILFKSVYKKLKSVNLIFLFNY